MPRFHVCSRFVKCDACRVQSLGQGVCLDTGAEKGHSAIFHEVMIGSLEVGSENDRTNEYK